MPSRAKGPDAEGVKDDFPGESRWPAAGVLLLCAVVLMAGYAFAIWRGPAPAQEVRVVTVPAPEPVPAAEAE